MCQALASDEEDDEESTHYRGRRGPLPHTADNPGKLSSTLMKTLRLGEEEEGEDFSFGLANGGGKYGVKNGWVAKRS